jgi:diketogulonate reductase-like aldo/keto reductase
MLDEAAIGVFQNPCLYFHISTFNLHWLIQSGVVAIPKSVRKERIAENFNVFDLELSAEEMTAIATLGTKTRKSCRAGRSETPDLI